VTVYTRTDSKNNVYQFTEDRETLAGWGKHGTGKAHSDGFTTVAKRTLSKPEGIAFGRGTSQNPDKAEAYFYLDARSDDEDSDSTPDKLNGQYELVVLNAANEVVNVIDRGRLDEVRKGDPSNDTRGDWGKPFPYKAIAGGKGEILGGAGHSIGLRVNLDSGEDSLVVGNSTMVAEGYGGRLIN
jgi:hypothetical protein